MSYIILCAYVSRCIAYTMYYMLYFITPKACSMEGRGKGVQTSPMDTRKAYIYLHVTKIIINYIYIYKLRKKFNPLPPNSLARHYITRRHIIIITHCRSPAVQHGMYIIFVSLLQSYPNSYIIILIIILSFRRH